MKKKMMTRTQLAKHMGVTIATLKDHLVHQDILEANGKSPSVRAHLEGYVEWTLLPSDDTQRFFLLDVALCEKALAKLQSTKTNRPPLIASKNAAIKILNEAGANLSEAINPERSGEVEPYGTKEIGWLAYGCAIDCMTAQYAQEKRDLADRLEIVLKQIQEDIDKNLIMAGKPNMKPAMNNIRAVMQWFRGGNPNAAETPKGEKPVPPDFHALDSERELITEGTGGEILSVTIPVSENEIRLIRAGHTLRREGKATGPVLDAVARACGLIYDIWSGERQVNYARISIDGEKMFLSDWDANSEADREHLFTTMKFRIDGDTITIIDTDEDDPDEARSVGVNAMNRHFGPERVKLR